MLPHDPRVCDEVRRRLRPQRRQSRTEFENRVARGLYPLAASQHVRDRASATLTECGGVGALRNGFGFGGVNATLVLRRWGG